MLKKLVLSITIIIVLLIYLFICGKDKTLISLDYIKDPCEVVVIPKNDSKELYFTLKFKNAGVFHNNMEKHGISPLVSKLLFRKIGNLSEAATEENLKSLGILHIRTNGMGDDFVISFRIIESHLDKAIKFLSDIFIPNFSENDLAWAKEYFPIQINPENSSPSEILYEKLYKNLYPKHLYGENTTGSSRAITGITLGDIKDFFKNNFTKDNLKIYCAGKCTASQIKKLLKELLKNLPETGEKVKVIPLNNIKTLQEVEKIQNTNIKDVVGITLGIRLDNLSLLEKAAMFVLADALFDEDEGEFLKEIKDIPVNFAYSINARKLSTILIVTAFVNAKDADSYLDHLIKLIDRHDLSKNKNLEISQQYFFALQKRGIGSLSSISQSLEFLKLPFFKCNQDIYKKLNARISDKSNRNIVLIGSK